MLFQAPIDLSGLPDYQAAAVARPRRIAWIGRCSTEDRQNPRSSLRGQYDESRALLQPGEEIMGCYWDVESGMLGLEERSQGAAEDYARLGVGLRRDGGLAELLEAVQRGEITHVICERVSRVARRMLSSLRVEEFLEEHGVELLAANEPQGGLHSGRLHARRSAQVNAEIAREEMQEMSMRGQRQHAASGYQHGYPAYGYIAVIDPKAPPPVGGRWGGGRPKKRLVLHEDPLRPATVAEVHRLRREERTDGLTIARLLASDLSRHPLGERQTRWTRDRVEAMIAQPKYTGYQVYGRRATRTGRGRWNPPSEWVWSREQAHPAIVTLEEWLEAQLVTASLRTPAAGWERAHALAAEHGTTLTKIRSNATHSLYLVAGREIVVPRGDLTSEALEQIRTLLEATA